MVELFIDFRKRDGICAQVCISGVKVDLVESDIFLGVNTKDILIYNHNLRHSKINILRVFQPTHFDLSAFSFPHTCGVQT